MVIYMVSNKRPISPETHFIDFVAEKTPKKKTQPENRNVITFKETKTKKTNKKHYFDF